MLEDFDALWIGPKSGRSHRAFPLRRHRTGGITGQWERSEVDEAELKLERRWDLLSDIGLWSVIIGIALQGVGVWFAP